MAPLWLLYALSVNFLPVKILATIVLSLFTLLACGMFLLSSVLRLQRGTQLCRSLQLAGTCYLCHLRIYVSRARSHCGLGYRQNQPQVIDPA